MSKRIYVFAALIIALASTGCISQLSQDEIDNRVNTYFEKHADTTLGQKTKSFEREFPFTMNDGITNFKNGKAYALYGVINRIQIYQDIDKSVPLAVSIETTSNVIMCSEFPVATITSATGTRTTANKAPRRSCSSSGST